MTLQLALHLVWLLLQWVNVSLRRIHVPTPHPSCSSLHVMTHSNNETLVQVQGSTEPPVRVALTNISQQGLPHSSHTMQVAAESGSKVRHAIPDGSTTSLPLSDTETEVGVCSNSNMQVGVHSKNETGVVVQGNSDNSAATHNNTETQVAVHCTAGVTDLAGKQKGATQSNLEMLGVILIGARVGCLHSNGT